MLTKSEINKRYRESDKGKEYRASGRGAETQRKYKHSDKGKEVSNRYNHSQGGRQTKKEANARYRTRHRWEAGVQRLVNRAKKLSILIAQPCQVCGKPNAFAHHDDYDKPLEVKWLCNYHHSEYHRNLVH